MLGQYVENVLEMISQFFKSPFFLCWLILIFILIVLNTHIEKRKEMEDVYGFVIQHIDLVETIRPVSREKLIGELQSTSLKVMKEIKRDIEKELNLNK